MMWRRAALLALLATVSACASVPLTTTWMMRSFTLGDFFSKEPHDLRVAIRTDDRIRRGANDPVIAVRVDGVATTSVCYAFALVPVAADGPAELTLDKPAAHRRWYVFALSRNGIDAFERARREVRQNGVADRRFDLDVSTSGVLDFADGRASAPLRIDVALDRKEGYFTLNRERSLDAGETNKMSPAGTAEIDPATTTAQSRCPEMPT